MSYSCDEQYDVYAETDRKARKAHRCSACRETIPAKMRYTVISIVYDGTVESVKRCHRCQEIHEHLRELCSHGDHMWPDEKLDCGEKYEEEWGTEPPVNVQALAFLLPGETLETSPLAH